MKKTASLLAALALALPLTAALAQEADLRKTLGQRLPSLSNIDEVSKTPMQGVYEIRVGNDILYADAKGDFVLQGNLIDTRARKNLTEERIEKLTAIQFDALPLKNAIKCAARASARWPFLKTRIATTATSWSTRSPIWTT